MSKIVTGKCSFFNTTIITTALNELTLPSGDCYQTVLESEWEDRVGGVKKTLFLCKNGKKGNGSVVTDQFDRTKDNWATLDSTHLQANFERYENYDDEVRKEMKVYRCAEDKAGLYFQTGKSIFLGWTGCGWPGYSPVTKELWNVRIRVESTEFNQQNFDQWCQKIAEERSTN